MTDSGSGRRSRRRNRFTVAVLAAVTAVVLAACGTAAGGGATHTNASANAALTNPDLDPGTSIKGRQAPDFTLTNQFGQRMSLSQFRGKVILLAFVDSRCTTVCPLTTQEMLQAKQELGASGKNVQLLGVDANPDATSVSDVMAYSRAHGMVNRWDFLTGSKAQLEAVWKKYHIAVAINQGQIDHTPALFLIGRGGGDRDIYLTQMAYASIAQQAQILAKTMSKLTSGRPKVRQHVSLTYLSGIGPGKTARMPSATSGGTVTLAAGTPHLVMFFATWLSETSDLKKNLAGLNSYVSAARSAHLPALTAVDEEVTERGPGAVRNYLTHLGTVPAYPVGMDETGRVADGYQVQDQPWFALTSASGQIVWYHDGWLSPTALLQAVRSHEPSGG